MGPQPPPGAAIHPDRDKRRKIVLLRGLLVVAVGGMLMHAGISTAGFAALALLVVFALSDLALALSPLHRVSLRVELLLGAADLALVGLGIYLAGAASGALPVSCLLMVLVVALANDKSHAVAGAAAASALHAWLVTRVGQGPGLGTELVLQLLFLCAVGLYYGFLTEGLHRLRFRQAAGDLERRELSALIEILELVTSSLDLRRVTHAIVTRLNDIVPSVRCSILHVDERRRRCTVMASHDAPELGVLQVDLDKYPEIRKAIRTRDPVIVQDVTRDPLMEQVREHLKAVDFRSIVVIPLTFGDDVLGTLCLKTARVETRFSEREIRFCNAVARASSNALKNAILHRQVLEESARRRSTGEKLGRILQHSPDPILTTDRRARITEFNRGAERLLGYRRDELLGNPCDRLLAEADDFAAVRRTLSSGVPHSHTCRLERKGGGDVEVELHMAPLRDASDEIVGTVWIGRDVTELRQTQLQLIQREKLSSIGQVISGVAHELNNPLSAVLGFSQLLLVRHADTPVGRDLKKIADSAERCQKIVRNLLSFARAHTPERKHLSINSVLEKTLDLKAYQLRVHDIEVACELDPSIPSTMLDPYQLQQVFLNLINNAQQAMSGARERPWRLSVRTSSTDGWIRIGVGDNGEGMDGETLQRVFDPFFTTKSSGEGTGLGLAVSYGIVKEHGGRIFADSTPGEGSTFVVELPVVRPDRVETQAERRPSPEAVCEPGGSRILVVDDEPLILELLLDVLEGDGHRVDTAADGSEAWSKVGSNDYDLVITDVRMPRMDGLEFYRNLLCNHPRLEGRVVFITGDLIDTATVDFLAEVNAPTIPKPIEIDRISAIVQETLTERSGPR